jgi:galactokinase
MSLDQPARDQSPDIAGQVSHDARLAFFQTFGRSPEMRLVAAPGRVNLIGEHIDYHGMPVLPMALGRRVCVAFRPRKDERIRAVSAGYGIREFLWRRGLERVAPGDWENYLRAAANAVAGKWGTGRGVDAALASDLPPAAGLSSSSALIVAFTLALLRANGLESNLNELMEILPEGEHFVGTRGGGMDHAASLASRRGCASLIEFEPFAVRPVPIPAGWAFLVAHSMTTAEKSGPAREEYNARRTAGSVALARLGFRTYREAVDSADFEHLSEMATSGLDRVEADSFLHVTGEALRVRAAVRALETGDMQRFGALLLESHASLRDRLRVSCSALDRLVEAAMDSGAIGARLTGAGFGGCVVCLTRAADSAAVKNRLVERYFAGRRDFDKTAHLIEAVPAAGALFMSL